MRVLIAYDSLSGHTEMVAKAVHEVVPYADMLHLTPDKDYSGLGGYDLYLLGTWTCDGGRTPDDMKYFIYDTDLESIDPRRIAIFGTGETEFGSFCMATERIKKYYGSPYETLKIEQMPHTENQYKEIYAWTKYILKEFTNGIQRADIG